MAIKPLLTRRRVLAGLVAGGLLFSAGWAAAAPTDHGGARRLTGDQTAAVQSAVVGGTAKNVILLIGDGMGDSELTSARNYQYGAGGRLPGLDALPLTGQYTTYSLTKAGKTDYLPDSAATGTAFATGTKTYDGAVSVNITGTPQRSLLELAKVRGLKTGNVTTAAVQDATPAVQAAHVPSRSCTSPSATTRYCPSSALEKGGPGSIAEQILTTRADLTLGGGGTPYRETATAGTYAGQTLLQQATARGFQIVNSKDRLNALTAADQTRPVLGLFASSHLPTRWVGPAATRDGGQKAPARCSANPNFPGTVPNLAEMTDKAIKLLSNDPDGFFLQVEGASIDKQDHAANACGQIGETIDLDVAVRVALAFAKANGNTSVFVTADHAHSSQIVEAGSVTPGVTTNLLTLEGSPMTISYATSPEGASQQHTGTQLRVAGYGPQAGNIVGLTDQTDLFFTISRALTLGG